jgi:uncharacterized protein YjiS (DUF1127 family)
MSCGSTSCNPIHNFEAVSTAFPDLRRSWHRPLALLTEISLGWDRRYQYCELLQLDDRLLADIGLSRTAVEEVRRSSLYLLAWRDSR